MKISAKNGLFIAAVLVVASWQISAFGQSIKNDRTQFSLNARSAYARWQAAPKKIKILDVRTQAEYIFVGHAPMAYNIPLMFLSAEFNTETKRYDMPFNMNFVAEVKAKFQENDTLFVMCRSGSRSAKSVKMLQKAGFKFVYNISDGFEGSKLIMPGSYKNGRRIINGWKNSGAPWTSKVEAEKAYIRKK